MNGEEKKWLIIESKEGFTKKVGRGLID